MLENHRSHSIVQKYDEIIKSMKDSGRLDRYLSLDLYVLSAKGEISDNLKKHINTFFDLPAFAQVDQPISKQVGPNIVNIELKSYEERFLGSINNLSSAAIIVVDDEVPDDAAIGVCIDAIHELYKLIFVAYYPDTLKLEGDDDLILLQRTPTQNPLELLCQQLEANTDFCNLISAGVKAKHEKNGALLKSFIKVDVDQEFLTSGLKLQILNQIKKKNSGQAGAGTEREIASLVKEKESDINNSLNNIMSRINESIDSNYGTVFMEINTLLDSIEIGGDFRVSEDEKEGIAYLQYNNQKDDEINSKIATAVAHIKQLVSNYYLQNIDEIERDLNAEFMANDIPIRFKSETLKEQLQDATARIGNAHFNLDHSLEYKTGKTRMDYFKIMRTWMMLPMGIGMMFMYPSRAITTMKKSDQKYVVDQNEGKYNAEYGIYKDEHEVLWKECFADEKANIELKFPKKTNPKKPTMDDKIETNRYNAQQKLKREPLQTEAENKCKYNAWIALGKKYDQNFIKINREYRKESGQKSRLGTILGSLGLMGWMGIIMVIGIPFLVTAGMQEAKKAAEKTKEDNEEKAVSQLKGKATNDVRQIGQILNNDTKSLLTNLRESYLQETSAMVRSLRSYFETTKNSKVSNLAEVDSLLASMGNNMKELQAIQRMFAMEASQPKRPSPTTASTVTKSAGVAPSAQGTTESSPNVEDLMRRRQEMLKKRKNKK